MKFRLIVLALLIACGLAVTVAASAPGPTPDVVIGCHCCFSNPSYCSVATKLGVCC